MVEIHDDIEMVAASERDANQFDSAHEDDPYQETSLANELKQMDNDKVASQGNSTQQAVDDDAIPFNI